MRDRAPFFAAALFAAVLCVLRVMFGSPYAASWDAVDFALALDRFDLLAMQPHFPGYPFYVLSGMLLRPLFGDPVVALSAVSALAYASAVLPMYRLVRATMPAWPAAATTALLQGASYFWVIASQPMSEGMAVAALWWYWWSVHLAMDAKRFTVRLLPTVLFGLLMGIRLSYVVFGAALLLLLQRELAESGPNSRVERSLRFRRGAGFAASAVLFQLAWVGMLVISEGSVSGFFQLSVEFARGHFTDWGGAATAASSMPLGERFTHLAIYNLIWVGLCGGSVWNAAALATSAMTIVWAGGRGRQTFLTFSTSAQSSNLRWLIAVCLLYVLWAVFAQNVDKPRHIAPLIGPALWMLALALQRAAHRKRWAAALAALCLLAVQLAVGGKLLHTLRFETPAVVALHEQLSHRDESDFIVYTWEETRVLQYMKAAYPHKRVFTFALFEEELRARPDRTALLTNAVVEGFLEQGIDVTDRISPVGTFVSNPVIEPVYDRITLYEWKR